MIGGKLSFSGLNLAQVVRLGVTTLVEWNGDLPNVLITNYHTWLPTASTKTVSTERTSSPRPINMISKMDQQKVLD